jgi:hypothetical protein
MITKKLAYFYAIKYNIDLSIVPINEWYIGLIIETEHKDISNDNIDIYAKIVIAHLKEDPRYYKYLIKLEKFRKKYWSSRVKPSIFKI